MVLAVVASPSAVAIPGYQACPPGDTYALDVRGISCEDAARVASTYDFEGDKFQEIEGYTCYGAQADVYPIVLTCVAGDSEVVVSEI